MQSGWLQTGLVGCLDFLAHRETQEGLRLRLSVSLSGLSPRPWLARSPQSTSDLHLVPGWLDRHEVLQVYRLVPGSFDRQEFLQVCRQVLGWLDRHEILQVYYLVLGSLDLREEKKSPPRDPMDCEAKTTPCQSGFLGRGLRGGRFDWESLPEWFLGRGWMEVRLGVSPPFLLSLSCAA